MPTDDYSAVVSGGLKIKGVNPSSKISKHKKKKPKPETDPAAAERSKEEGEGTATQKGDTDSTSTALTKNKGTEGDEEDALREKEEALTLLSKEGKTDAELRHEERRRKRVSITSKPSFHFTLVVYFSVGCPC